MKKRLFNIAALHLLSIVGLLSHTVTVCPSCKVNSIQEGLNLTNDGDTLVISGGIYNVPNIVVDNAITIIGKNNPVLISSEGDEILTIIEDGVTIKGLTLKNVTTSYLKERSAIRIKRSTNFKILENKIIDCFFGIYLEHAKDGIIKNNILKGNATTEAESGNGVHAWYSDRIIIEDNKVTGHRDGIYFEFVNNSRIARNHSEKNKRYGLHFMFSNDDEYMNNVFRNNGVGVAVMFSRRIKMEYNAFEYNWGRSAYGLLLKEIYDAEIFNNTFEQNTIGIFVEGSNRILYMNNVFSRNGWAIKFSGGCEDNDISYNNFLSNSLDLVVNTKLSSNKFHHNYWSAYSGYDLDKNGIGDVPHYPVKLFSYVLDQAPEAIVLMRSLFVDIINFAERVSPVFTPKEVIDEFPLMQEWYDKD